MTVAHDVREWRSAPALAGYVTCVWTQTVSSLSAAFTHRKAPHGSVELVCAIGSSPRIFGWYLHRFAATDLSIRTAPFA